VITLYNFGPAWGLPDASPFCLKVDAYLRAVGLQFKVDPGMHHLRSAPKRKLPFIRDDDRVIADSGLILAYLRDRYGDPLDAHLSAPDRAIAHAFIKMMDENLYWCMVYARWMDERDWSEVRRQFFGAMPVPLRQVIPVLARRGVARSLYFHGLGRHSATEIADIAGRDLQSLSDFLGTGPYFFGAAMTTLDVVAYAFLAELIVPPLTGAIPERARSFANLSGFVARMRQQLYSSG